MTAPRFYSWDDDGSPGRALSGNNQDRLKQILVACLVNGYGSKPGAGWTLEHEHANGFTLSNGDAYVNFVSNLPASAPYPAMDTDAIHIYCAESLTDASGAIITGLNLCSGTYRVGEPEQVNYPRHALARAGAVLGLSDLQWTLVADDKTFTLNSSAGYSSNHNAGGSHSFTLTAGAALLDSPLSWNFLVLGGDIEKYNSSSFMYAFSRGYSAPRNLSTGIAQHAVTEAEPYASSATLESAGSTGSLPARINFQQPRLLSGGVFSGRLRGVVYDDLLRTLYSWRVGLKALGFSGSDFSDRGKVVEIEGYNYAFARSNSGNSFLTDNPAFW